jgi:hypothetical protein
MTNREDEARRCSTTCTCTDCKCGSDCRCGQQN